MDIFSTRYAAKKLDIDPSTLSRYIASGKIPAPAMIEVGACGCIHGLKKTSSESGPCCPGSPMAARPATQNRRKQNQHPKGRTDNQRAAPVLEHRAKP